MLPFPTDVSQTCYSTGKSGISVRLASTRKWQELFRMVIIPILCSFGPNVFVHNDNCLAKLLSGNLPIIKFWSNLQISKFSHDPYPLECGIDIIDVQIFNSAQIGKISTNQTDSLLAFGKLIPSLMYL